MHSEWQTPPCGQQRWRQGGWVRLCCLMSMKSRIPPWSQSLLSFKMTSAQWKPDAPLWPTKMEPGWVGHRSVPDAPPSGPPPAASLDVIQNDTRRENIRRPLVTNKDGARMGGLLRPSHSGRESPSLGPAPCSQPSCHSRWLMRHKCAIKIGAMVNRALWSLRTRSFPSLCPL